MSLHFPLMINGVNIGYFNAQRIKGDMIPDSINTYEIKVWTEQVTPDSDPDGDYKFTVKHQYGDGAWELIRVAMIGLAQKRKAEGSWNPRKITRKEFSLLDEIMLAEATASASMAKTGECRQCGRKNGTGHKLQCSFGR